MKMNKFGCGRVKGFTLIELVVVMAIIGILAGTSSVIISGFYRDSRIETNNKKAQMMYTTLQDILIDCEIKQDLSMFANPSSQYNKATRIFFHIDQDASGAVVVDENMSGDVYMSGGSSHSFPANNDDKERCKLLKAAIEKNLDTSLGGSYVVYLDLENYVVDSVICRELQGGVDPTMDLTSDAVAKCSKVKSKQNYSYKIFTNMSEHRKNYRSGSAEYGCYPYLSDIGGK